MKKIFLSIIAIMFYCQSAYAQFGGGGAFGDTSRFLDEYFSRESTYSGVTYPDVNRAKGTHNWNGGMLPIVGAVWSDDSSFTQPEVDKLTEPFLIADPDSGAIYAFYEHGYDASSFNIRASKSTDNGKTWTVLGIVLDDGQHLGTGATSDPDYYAVADPTVIYVPWAEHKWHMWYDMAGNNASYTYSVWTIGHAYADSPDGPWTKQTTGSVTDIVAGTTAHVAKFDDGLGQGPWTTTISSDKVQLGHAPVAFLYGGRVHLLVFSYGAATDSTRGNFDASLYIANDSQGVGSQFEIWGPVTWDTTIHNNDAYRSNCVYSYNNTLYMILKSYNSASWTDTRSAWVSSTDGGKSWGQLGDVPPMLSGSNPILIGNKFYMLHTEDSPNHDTYALSCDMDNLTYSTLWADNDKAASNTVLPLIHNVAKNYYLNGTALDTAYLWDTAAGMGRRNLGNSSLGDAKANFIKDVYDLMDRPEDVAALWLFDEQTSSTIVDKTGNGRNLTTAEAISTGYAGVTKILGLARGYDVARTVTSRYFTAADDDAFSFNNGVTDLPFTLVFFGILKDMGLGNGRHILSKNNYATASPYDKEWGLRIDNDNKLSFELNDTAGAGAPYRKSAVLSGTDFTAPTTVIATYNGVGGANAYLGMNLYKNGANVNIGASASTYTNMRNGIALVGNTLYGGNYNSVPGQNLYCGLMIIRKELTPTQVLALDKICRGYMGVDLKTDVLDPTTDTEWRTWTPTLVWATADPTLGTAVCRYRVKNGICSFNMYIPFTDGNNSTGITSATLPITPRDNNTYTSCSVTYLVDSTYSVGAAVVDSLTPAGILGRVAPTLTDTKAGNVVIAGEYEI